MIWGRGSLPSKELALDLACGFPCDSLNHALGGNTRMGV